MGPGLARPRTRLWVVPDTWTSWYAILRKITSESPKLRMIYYYYYYYYYYYPDL